MKKLAVLLTLSLSACTIKVDMSPDLSDLNLSGDQIGALLDSGILDEVLNSQNQNTTTNSPAVAPAVVVVPPSNEPVADAGCPTPAPQTLDASVPEDGGTDAQAPLLYKGRYPDDMDFMSCHSRSGRVTKVGELVTLECPFQNSFKLDTPSEASDWSVYKLNLNSHSNVAEWRLPQPVNGPNDAVKDGARFGSLSVYACLSFYDRVTRASVLDLSCVETKYPLRAKGVVGNGSWAFSNNQAFGEFTLPDGALVGTYPVLKLVYTVLPTDSRPDGSSVGTNPDGRPSWIDIPVFEGYIFYTKEKGDKGYYTDLGYTE